MKTSSVSYFLERNAKMPSGKKAAAMLELSDQININGDPIYLANPYHIRTDEDLFQCRELTPKFSDARYRSDSHVRKLQKGLTNPKNELEPISIAWMRGGEELSDLAWFVIDGHHRLKAYQLAERNKIPVTLLKGEPVDLVMRAIESNIKDKLPMSSSDKLEAAWSVWVAMHRDPSRWKRVLNLGVSKGTASNFKKVEQELWDRYHDPSHEWARPPTELTWREARKANKNLLGDNRFDEEALVREWAEKLFKAFGPTAKKSPDIFMRASRLYIGESYFDYLQEFFFAEDNDF